jgi:hypothetical protein
MLVGVLLLLMIVMPRLPHDPPLPTANVAARSRLALLDSYDTTARPIGIRYDPFHFDSASAIAARASLSVRPGLRGDPQPIRVLHNGRFSLPAGRYEADFEWIRGLAAPVPISLQVGRIEPVWQTWQVQPQTGAHWAVDFDLPLDANFVGFRGSTDVERAVSRLTIRPLALVDEGARPNLPSVLATRQYGEATTMFHDEQSAPEATGFWVFGGETAKFSVVRGDNQQSLSLRIHTGPEPNRVTISMRGWHETLPLDPITPRIVTLPDSNHRLLTIDIHPESGFTPQKYDPRSDDTRFLGVWVEVVGTTAEK